MLHWLLFCCLKVNGKAFLAAGERGLCVSGKAWFTFWKVHLILRGFVYHFPSILTVNFLCCGKISSPLHAGCIMALFFTASMSLSHIQIHRKRCVFCLGFIQIYIIIIISRLLVSTVRFKVRFASVGSQIVLLITLLMGMQQISGLFQRQAPSSKDMNNNCPPASSVLKLSLF